MLLLSNDETSRPNGSTNSVRQRRTNKMPLKSLYKDSNTPNKPSNKKLTLRDGEFQTASAGEIEMELLSKSNQVAKDYQVAAQTIKTSSANKNSPKKSDQPDHISKHNKKNMPQDFYAPHSNSDSHIDFSSRLQTSYPPKPTPKNQTPSSKPNLSPTNNKSPKPLHITTYPLTALLTAPLPARPIAQTIPEKRSSLDHDQDSDY